MALALDAGPTGYGLAANASTIATTSRTYTTALTGTILICCINAAWAVGAGAAGTVSGVTGGTGLTWARRARLINSLQGSTGTDFTVLELWWAYAALAQTAITITATFNLPGGNNFGGATIGVMGVTGFTGGLYITSPWDGNAVLPVYGSAHGANSNPTVNISTTNAATMAIGLGCSTWNTSFSAVGSGYSSIIFLDYTPGGAFLDFCYSGMEDQIFSSPQSGKAVNFTNNPFGWSMIGDALAQTGGVTIPSTQPTLFVA